MKEAIRDKMKELIRSGRKIPENNVGVLDLIDTSDLYGLINENEATYAEQEEINDLNEELRHLRPEVRGNMDNDDYVSHDETITVNNVSKPNNTIGTHIVEGKEESFCDWVNTYDEWNRYYHTSTEEDKSESSHTFTGDNDIFIIKKIKHNGSSKTRLVSKTSTSVNSDFYTG